MACTCRIELGGPCGNPPLILLHILASLILKHHTLYAHHGNWTGLMQPALASMFPVPQRYYVPGRIRECHKARLEAAGLWHPEVEKQEKKSFPGFTKSTKETVDSRVYLQAFEQERV
jgi:sorting and assembly machinery component 37